MVRTLKGWEQFTQETGLDSWYDYANVGDEVREEVINYFTNILDPRTHWSDLLQVGGNAYDYIQNEDGHWRGLYMTFAVIEGAWTYCGHCFVEETVHRSNVQG